MSHASERVIEVLRERGWQRGRFVSRDGVCLRGAMMVAQSEDTGDTEWLRNPNEPYPFMEGEYRELYDKLNEMIEAEVGRDASLISFNDDLGTDLEEVIDLVERAGEL